MSFDARSIGALDGRRSSRTDGVISDNWAICISAPQSVAALHIANYQNAAAAAPPAASPPARSFVACRRRWKPFASLPLVPRVFPARLNSLYGKRSAIATPRTPDANSHCVARVKDSLRRSQSRSPLTRAFHASITRRSLAPVARKQTKPALVANPKQKAVSDR